MRGIITLASTLKMDVVAEGVETNEQRRILNALNVTYAQGYLFSRPLEADQVAGFITSKTTTPGTAAQPPAQIGIDSAPLQSIAVN